MEGAAMLSDSAVDIVELNISCPNVKVGGMAYGVKAEAAGEVAVSYTHLVVPEGNGWTEDPFKMEIRDGWMIGRGVADDKGPMVATPV